MEIILSEVVSIQIFFVIILIFLMILMVISIKDSYKYKKTSIYTEVKVISKRQKNSSKKTNNKDVIDKEYYILFEDKNGRQQEFSVEKDEYKRLNKGYNGKLNFKGTEYIKFEKKV